MIRLFSPSTIPHPWRDALLIVLEQVALIVLLVKLNAWL